MLEYLAFAEELKAGYRNFDSLVVIEKRRLNIDLEKVEVKLVE